MIRNLSKITFLSRPGGRMLLLDKTLLKMTKGLWIWIVSLVVIRVCSLVMITNFASSISYFLGNMMSPSFTHD